MKKDKPVLINKIIFYFTSYRRKVDTLENDRLKAPSPEGERLNRSQDDNDLSDWERRRQEEQDEARREEEERRRREEEEARRDEQERADIAEQAKLQKSDSDQVKNTVNCSYVEFISILLIIPSAYDSLARMSCCPLFIKINIRIMSTLYLENSGQEITKD